MELFLLLQYAGDPRTAADQAAALAAFRDSGVTTLSVTPVGPTSARLIEKVKSWL